MRFAVNDEDPGMGGMKSLLQATPGYLKIFLFDRGYRSFQVYFFYNLDTKWTIHLVRVHTCLDVTCPEVELIYVFVLKVVANYSELFWKRKII